LIASKVFAVPDKAENTGSDMNLMAIYNVPLTRLKNAINHGKSLDFDSVTAMCGFIPVKYVLKEN